MKNKHQFDFVIGIHGPAGSGKDTLSVLLSNQLMMDYDLIAVSMAYADELKRWLADAIQVPVSIFYDTEVKDKFRPLLTLIGTDLKRNPLYGGDDNIWVNKLSSEVKKWPSDFEVLIIPDVRYPNEAKNVLSWETNYPHLNSVIEIKPIGHTGTTHLGHSSESGLPPNCITDEIYNDHNAGVSSLDLAIRNWLKRKLVNLSI